MDLDSKDYLESDTFCMAPWMYLHTWPDGAVYPCCMTPSDQPFGHLSGSSIQEQWNSEKMRKLRKDMLAKKKISSCDRCYKIQDSGAKTLRHTLNRDFGKHFSIVNETKDDGSLEGAKIRYLDVRFSNVCNFKCRTCGPQLSSGWYDDHKALYGTEANEKVIRPFEDEEELWRQLEPLVEDLDSIYFAGGEPLITTEHYKILEALIRLEKFDVKLVYNTNFSIIKYAGFDVLDMWSKFEKVNIGASLDAEGSRGEYMRKGQNWEKTVSNRQALMERCPHVEFHIAPTLGCLNAFDLPDFHKSWVEKKYIGVSDLVINYVLDPMYYRVQILPKSIKDKVEEKYLKHIREFIQPFGQQGERAQSMFESAIQFMWQEDHFDEFFDAFIKRNEMVDRVRNENFRSTFPEFQDMMPAQ